MKRFYKNASPVRDTDSTHWLVHLDGKPVMTPAKKKLICKTEALARAIASEWDSQSGTIKPESMPLTQYAITCIDRIDTQRAIIERACLSYLDTDLLRYRTTTPQALAAQQERDWGPWIRWFEAQAGTTLPLVTSLQAVPAGTTAQAHMAKYLEGLDEEALTCVQAATSLTGSLILAYALQQGTATIEQCVACHYCEELFYEAASGLETYGTDPEEAKRREILRRELEAAWRYYQLSAIPDSSARV